ncbi:MAG: Holliday junction resolvase RuvX [Clostridia bacterium]|nr:Holliday junction resolvase RuvX [Clostridia bacterium]
MRVICLDIGEKRIGVAVSDALDLTAQGLETIWTKGFERDAARVLELCRQYDTDRVLCGLPLNMDGSAGFQAERIRAFAARLEEAGLKIRFQDERMTTKLARDVLIQGNVRREKRKDVIDKLAATFILQSFLDSGGWREADEHKKIYLRGVWHMTENMGSEFDMEREDIVTLEDEDGNEVRFEHLMTLEHNGGIYICLVPVDPMEDVAEDELVIMRIEQTEDGQDVYVTIEDEDELNGVFEKYLEIAEADEDDE